MKGKFVKIVVTVVQLCGYLSLMLFSMMFGINLLVPSEQQSYICFHLSLLRN